MSRYQRHSYMWSNHSLTDGAVGWGITASSDPKNKRRLKELEKLASSMPAPLGDQQMTEGLSYGRECGFVTMLAKPYASGEDHRRNKQVQIFELCDHNEDFPEAYLLRQEWTKDEPKDGYLPEIVCDPEVISVKELVHSLGLEDRFISLIDAMMFSLLEENQSLDIVIPGLSEEHFGLYTNQLMLLFHKFLPKALRNRAGYLSYSEEDYNKVAFYFSKVPCSKHILSLDQCMDANIVKKDYTDLEKYYLTNIAEHFIEEDALFAAYQEAASDYVMEHGDDAGLYSKLQWIFYTLEYQNKGIGLPVSYLKTQLPGLLFWGSKDDVCADIANWVSEKIHEEDRNLTDAEEYLSVLMNGISNRSKEGILNEMDWVLSRIWEKDPKLYEQQSNKMMEKNLQLFTELMLLHSEERDSYAAKWAEENLNELPVLKNLTEYFQMEYFSKQATDILLHRAIILLNSNIYDISAYEIVDQMAGKLGKKKLWVAILKGLLKQLESLCVELDESQLDCAVYIEKLYNHYVTRGKMNFCANEKARRLAAQQSEVMKKQAITAHISQKEGKEGILMSRNSEIQKQEVVDSSYELIEDETPSMSFLSYLMLGIPYGFFTGCAMFLGRYSLMIGHWKICLGMAGMLLLLFMNYLYTLIDKDTGYEYWKSIGLCLVEGVLILLVMSTKILEPYRVFLFMVCGIICLIIQAINLLKLKREKNL